MPNVPFLNDAAFIIVREFPPPEIEQSWRECLTRADLPAHYNAPEYFLSPLWQGKRPFAVLALQGRRVVGILTGIHEGKELTCGLQARPQICIDKQADPSATMDALAQGLLQEAGSAKLITLYSWSSTPLPGIERYGFRERKLEGDVVIDLSAGIETVFAGLDGNRRRELRRAMRKGVEIRAANSEKDIEDYFRVYEEWGKTERKEIHHSPNHSLETSTKIFHLKQNHIRFLATIMGR